MATQLPGGMTARIKNILIQPKEEWPRIDAEPMTEKGIMTGWVVPLAAIGPVAGLIGGQVFGYGGFGYAMRPTLGFSIGTAVFTYLLSLVSIWILAKVINALAPSFDGTKNPVQAMKVAGFSYTASFVAGIFQIVPALSFLGLLGLYSFYLLYLGLPRLMRAPQEKAIGYTVVTCICAIVLFVIVALVSGALMAAFMPAPDISALTGVGMR